MRRHLFLYLLLIAAADLFAQDSTARCERLIRHGSIYLEDFNAVESLDKFDTAITLASQLKNEDLLGRSLFGAGQARWYMGNFNGAIDTVTLSIQYLKKQQGINDGSWQYGSALRTLSNIYDQTGNYEEAFVFATEALDVFKKIRDNQSIILLLVQMGNLFRNTGDSTTAYSYYANAAKRDPQKGAYEYRELYNQWGRLYAATGKFDSALYSYRRALPGHPIPRNIYLRIAECYLLQNMFDTAYTYLTDVYKGAKSTNDVAIFVPAMIGLGKVFLHRDQRDSAVFMGREAYTISLQKGVRQNRRDASLLLVDIYEKSGRNDSAFIFYKQYVPLRDSILSEQLKAKLYLFKRKSEDMAQEAQLRLLRTVILVVVIVSVFIFFIFTLRHKNEKLRLQQKSAELEMQALRAQMNPHFIFNCLSAINHSILDNDTEKASDYLTRFARLIRLVLVNAEKNTISLEEELSMLTLYLDMEQLRFTNAFDYRIQYDREIQPSMINVPSFILQPFCENAVWHGLLHKEGKGELVIDLSIKDDVVLCIITDNGIGMAKAREIRARQPEAQKSFGHRLATERLALFNNHKTVSGSFTIENIVDASGNAAGTRVILQIKNKISV